MSSSQYNVCTSIEISSNIEESANNKNLEEIVNNGTDWSSIKSDAPFDLEFLTMNSKLFPENLQISKALNVRKEKKDKAESKNQKMKKSREDKEILKAFFLKDPSWSRKTVKTLKSMLSLPIDKIYEINFFKLKLIKKICNDKFTYVLSEFCF